MTVTIGAPAPAPAEELRPVLVEIIWTDRDGDRLTGLMNTGLLAPADSAALDALEATGRTDQFLITGGRRRRTLDAFNDSNTADQCHLDRVTPEAAARALADWCGFTGRPVTLKITDETKL
jgi:hypothetical protein